jgi:general secretion pathway protein K
VDQAGHYQYRGARLADENAVLTVVAEPTVPGEFFAQKDGVTYTVTAKNLVIKTPEWTRTEPVVQFGAQPLLAVEVPGGRLHGRLRDLGGCFNLNNLATGGGADELWGKRLRRLLRALKIDPELAASIADWIDADFEPQTRGAEDTQYLLATPPYRTGNRRFAHVSELRLVRGVTDEIYRRLAPEVCALPLSTPINVNTATPAVLMSLDDSIADTAARRLYAEGRARHLSVDAFHEAALQAGIAIADLRELATASEFFLASAEIELDGIPIPYTSLIQRRPGAIRVVARMRGSEAW